MMGISFRRLAGSVAVIGLSSACGSEQVAPDPLGQGSGGTATGTAGTAGTPGAAGTSGSGGTGSGALSEDAGGASSGAGAGVVSGQADSGPAVPAAADVISFDGSTPGQPCALRRNGDLWCIDTPVDQPAVFTQRGSFPGATAVVRGRAVTCVLAASGAVQCWGSGGLVGDGTTEARTEPTPVLGLTDAAQVDSWVGHSCAVRRGGAVACWGQNDFSQIEAGGDAAYTQPHAIAGIDSAVQVATSRLATCVLLEDGSVSCWADGFGATPTPVAGVADGVAITAGHFHFCVRSSSGSVACFGGENTGLEAVVPSPINDAAEAIAFHSETCYRDISGAVSCWGTLNQPGQTEPPALEPISGLEDAILLANRCAVRSSGTISCWSERNALIDITAGLE